MKKTFTPLLIFCILTLAVSCAGGKSPDMHFSGGESGAASLFESTKNTSDFSKTQSLLSNDPKDTSEMSEEMKKIPIPDGALVISNLNYDNAGGRMGDDDGPAYCVYSKIGYNRASMDIKISEIKINTLRKSDKKYVNAYLFLGADVYNGSWWANCFDAGFCYSGKNPAWHLFYNIYEPAEPGKATWYESSVRLDPGHDYRLTLDTSEEDQKATVVIYDLTAEKEADRVVFYVKAMKADGANTAYLMDFALDYPGDVKKDTAGNPSDDFVEITLYNTGEDLTMQNVLVENVKIYQNGTEFIWDTTHTQNRALWPDITETRVDYACTAVIVEGDTYDHTFRVDLDMNR